MGCLISLLALLIGLFALYVAFQALIPFIFLYVDLKLESLKDKPDEQMPNLGIFNFVYCFFKELGYISAKYVLYPVNWFHLLKDENDSPQTGTPVLLVHGYTRRRTDWLWFRKALKRAQIGPVYTINLSPIIGSIEYIAESVKEKAQHIRAETGKSDLILIGHSMGGLVSSYYAENLAPEDSIKGVVTIGSPLQGTRLAVLGAGENADEMAPDSSFLVHLNQQIADSKTSYFHVLTKLDNMVIPWTLGIPKVNKNNTYIVSNETHLGLLYSDNILQKITAHLTSLLS